MKKFKNYSILVLTLIIIIVGSIIYYTHNNNYDEIIYENVEKVEELDNKDEIVVHITGEVNKPGIVKLPEKSRVVDVIEAAGGLTKNADINKINLAQIVLDGQKINIPNINDTENGNINEYVEEIIQNSNINSKLININTATQTELETLTGIGPSTALNIIKYRKEKGGFKNIEEIKNVEGIGEAKYNKIKNSISIYD